MNLYDFQALSLADRANAVWEGTFLGDRPEGKFMVQLYNMHSFYAEVFYDLENNQITKVRGFKNTNIIEPYLEDIQIDF